MSPSDILTRAARPPDRVLRYGPGTDQYGDLRLPVWSEMGKTFSGERPASPLVIFLHGGFWRSAFDRTHTGPLAEALAAAGFAVCTPEFRRTGLPGGGWPGTFDDVAAAVDTLPGLAAEAADEAGGQVDTGRVVLGGHSAGGHLALWAAAGNSSLPVAGVVALAPVADLELAVRTGVGAGAPIALLGGGPDEVPDRYAAASPAALLPIGVPQVVVHGTADESVPFAMSERYVAAARDAGDDATIVDLPGVTHMPLIRARSEAWATARSHVQRLAGVSAD
jgi:dipeptidyl aminopeptidase/acylaminoacyl peptidase